MIGSISFGRNSLFLPCNLIGQFCLSDPGNSSHTITINIVCCGGGGGGGGGGVSVMDLCPIQNT